MTVTGSDCGRAQSITADSATVSSASPWTTSVRSCASTGSVATLLRDAAVPTMLWLSWTHPLLFAAALVLALALMLLLAHSLFRFARALWRAIA